MARSRKPEREEAFRLWLESGKKRALKDIAAELGVTDAQVRKWKKQDNWEDGSKGTQDIGVTFEKVRGGQKGNKNAKGRGAPKGNKNNFKHGIYESVYWNVLSDEEKQMIEELSFDEEEQLLIEQIRLLTVREYRFMRRVEEYVNTKGGLAVERVTSRKFEGENKNGAYSSTETVTQTVSTAEVIQKIEAELTKIQSRKTRCIEALNKLRSERRKFDGGDKENEIVNDWVAGLIGSDED